MRQEQIQPTISVVVPRGGGNGRRREDQPAPRSCVGESAVAFVVKQSWGIALHRANEEIDVAVAIEIKEQWTTPRATLQRDARALPDVCERPVSEVAKQQVTP